MYCQLSRTCLYCDWLGKWVVTLAEGQPVGLVGSEAPRLEKHKHRKLSLNVTDRRYYQPGCTGTLDGTTDNTLLAPVPPTGAWLERRLPSVVIFSSWVVAGLG